jgi:hypothetical protein
VYGFGTVASLAGIALIRCARLDDRSTLEALLRTIGGGVWLASGATLGLSALAAHLLFRAALAWRLFGVIAIGLVAGVVIGHFTEYMTAYTYAPTRSIAAAAARVMAGAGAADASADEYDEAGNERVDVRRLLLDTAAHVQTPPPPAASSSLLPLSPWRSASENPPQPTVLPPP